MAEDECGTGQEPSARSAGPEREVGYEAVGGVPGRVLPSDAPADWPIRGRIIIKRLRGELLTAEEIAWEAEDDRRQADARHAELMRQYDWVRNAPPWRRVLLRLFGSRGNWGWSTGQDQTCEVHCACGQAVWVAGSEWVSWCPDCGRGYTSEIRIRQYPAWLRMGRPDAGNQGA